MTSQGLLLIYKLDSVIKPARITRRADPWTDEHVYRMGIGYRQTGEIASIMLYLEGVGSAPPYQNLHCASLNQSQVKLARWMCEKGCFQKYEATATELRRR